MLAPILAFTADEIWENLPPAEETNPRAASVHLGTFPEPNEQADKSLISEWERLFEIREDVLRALEESRTAKLIGSSLEARIEISAAGDAYELLSCATSLLFRRWMCSLRKKVPAA